MVQNATNNSMSLPNSLPNSPPAIEVNREIAAFRENNNEPGNEHLFRKLEVDTTKFGIDLSSCPTIRLYSIQLFQKTANGLNNLMSEPNNDVEKIESQLLLHRILEEFIVTETFPNKLPPGSVVFDRKQYIYTASKIPDATNTELKLSYFQDEQLKEDVGSNTVSIIMKLRIQIKFNPNDISVGEVHLRHFLDSLLLAQACQKEQIILAGYVYNPSEKNPFVKGKIMKTGVSLVIETTAEDRTTFVFSLKLLNSAYHRGGPLLDYISRELQTPVDELTELLRSREVREKILKKLQGLYVSTTENNCFFQIGGLQQNNELMFYIRTPEMELVSSSNFIMSNNHGLRYPSLPLIVRKQDEAKWYFPMETLIVKSGQRIVFNEANVDLLAESLEKQKIPPLEYKKRVTAFNQANLGADNHFLKNFRVRIEAEAKKANAKTAIPPRIDYLNSSMNYSMNGPDPVLIWDAKPHTRFLRPVALYKWAVLILDQCVSSDDCKQFVDHLKMVGSIHGMKITTDFKIIFCVSSNREELLGYTQLLRENGAQFLMVAAEQQNEKTNELLGFLEITTGLPIHLFTTDIIVKGMDRRAPLSLTLPLQIINAKCGGLNFTLEVSKGLACDMKSKDRLICENLKRMYVGISVTFGDDRKPQAIGLAYSTTGVTDLKSIIWYQQSSSPIHIELKNKMAAAIKNYAQINGCRPTEIVVYRNITSEKENAKLAEEFEAVKDAKTLIGRDYRPSITLVSVVKEGNPRFLRRKILDIPSVSRQNVAPGLVIDVNRNDPKEGFYLVSSKTDKGISQSVRFNVVNKYLAYNPELKMDEIRWLTNALAYANQFHNSPGPVPSVATAAENVATRAFAAARISVRENPLINSDEYFKNLTEQIKGRVEGRHWWH